MPRSYQPVWTSVIERSFSTSRAPHPATRSALTRHAVNRVLMIELYIALDRTPGVTRGSLVVGHLHLFSDFFEGHSPGAERSQIAAFDAEDDGSRVGRVGRDERVPRHIVASGDGEPLLGAQRDGTAVLDHRIHERRLHFARVVLLGVIEGTRRHLTLTADRYGRGANPARVAKRRRHLRLQL